MKYGLLFSRFLNPEREAMPDIDIDFSRVGRERVIDYVKDKYGEENVSQMGTFSKMKGKSALKDVFRVKSIEGGYELANEIAKHIPDEAAIADELHDLQKEYGGEYGILRYAIEHDETILEYYHRKDLKECFDIAIHCEGVIRAQSRHASGVVVSPSPSASLFPLVWDSRSKQRIIGVDMDDVKNLGGIKLDPLGVSVLDKIKFAEDLVNA
jgi:DNA polymerase-3 subunit alpha